MITGIQTEIDVLQPQHSIPLMYMWYSLNVRYQRQDLNAEVLIIFQ